MKTVKFKEAGKWADSNPLLPQFEVEAGEEVLITNDLADIVVEAGKGKIIPADKTEAAEEKRKQEDAIAAGLESDAVKGITAKIAAMMSEKDFLLLEIGDKSSSDLADTLADLEATATAEKEAAEKEAAKRKRRQQRTKVKPSLNND